MWNKNVTLDSFLGQATVRLEVDAGTKQYTKNLMGRRSKKDEATKGSILFTVKTTTDLRSV